MENNNYGSDEKKIIERLIEKVNSQTIIIIFLSMVIAILAIAFVNIETRVNIEWPPKYISNNTQEIHYDISNDSASEEYYKMWGYYYITETATFKSKEIRKKIALIKRAYDPERLKKQRIEIDEKTGKEFKTTDNKELDEFSKNIRKEKVSQTFIPTKVNKPEVLYDNSEASLKIDGLATQIFEKMPTDPITQDKPCYYEIKLNRNGGNTYVNAYKTNCFD